MSIRLVLDGTAHEVSIVRRRPHLVLLIDGVAHEISDLPDFGDGRRSMTVGGHALTFTRALRGEGQIVRLDGRTFEIALVNPLSAGDASGGSSQDAVKAPMPGAVVSIHCAVGQTVRRGETLVTIESMKLQTALQAPRDGVVAEIRRAESETFDKDEIMVVLEPVSEKA